MQKTSSYIINYILQAIKILKPCPQYHPIHQQREEPSLGRGGEKELGTGTAGSRLLVHIHEEVHAGAAMLRGTSNCPLFEKFPSGPPCLGAGAGERGGLGHAHQELRAGSPC